MTNHPLTPRRNRATRAQTRVEAQQTPVVPLWAVVALAIGVGLLALI